jgi:photosynthetic reaction center H subunit
VNPPSIGAFTGYIDVAQLCLYAFWLFFFGLVYYLLRENKREGYPLVSDRTGRAPRVKVVGWPDVPAPKTFLVQHGQAVHVPGRRTERSDIAAKPYGAWPGAPLVPTGDPMIDGIGAASWAEREDKPELTIDGEPLIQPLRVVTQAFVEPRDPDPRGMKVVAADGKVAGTVGELWVDRSEPQVRYLEVDLAEGDRKVLLPIYFARVNRKRREVKVRSILAHQFTDVPANKYDDRVTKLEEDKITGYYAGGKLYATPQRLGPVL